MIVTLTPNPSHDRTVALGRTARARRRAARRVGDLAGRRQGREHLPRRRSPPASHSIAVLPAPEGRPVRARAARRRHRLPAGRHDGGPLRVNITISEPDGTTTKLNSPGADRDAASCWPRSTESLRAAPPPPTGWCWPARCRPARRSAGTPTWSPSLRRHRRPRRGRHQRRPAAGPGRRGCPSSAPHLMKPNGEELASFTGGDADELESDPRRRRRRGPHPGRPRRRRPCSSPSGRRRGAGHRRRRLARHSRRPPTVVSTVGAGDSSLFGYLLGDVRAADPRPTTRARRRLRQRGRRTSRHDHPAPLAGPPRAGLGPRPRPSPKEGDDVRPDHDRSGAPRRRPRPGQARRDPGPRRRRRRSRVAPPTPTSSSRTPWPARQTSPTGLPGGIAIPHCRTTGVDGAHARLRPARARRSTSAPRTARPTSPS